MNRRAIRRVLAPFACWSWLPVLMAQEPVPVRPAQEPEPMLPVDRDADQRGSPVRELTLEE
ncbi:MAG: hypothetical protein FJ265_08235, partial [Planctomycetes bacterium]|nr:hypothetical protein [Planctomycetota bacterium]